MRQKHIVTALAIFAVTGIVGHSPSIAEAGQGNVITRLNGMVANTAHLNKSWRESRLSSSPLDRSLIHRVGAETYPGSLSGISGAAPSSPQGTVQGNQPRSTEDYKFSSPGNDSRYGAGPSNPSDNYFKKESSGSSSGPYGGSVYGGPPSTPSADPMIKDLSR